MPTSIEVPIEPLTPTVSPIDNLGLFVSRLTVVGLVIASMITILFFVWGGIQWLTAGDDKANVEKARSRITNALLGLVIVAVAWAMFLFVDYFLGIGVADGSSGGGGGGGGGNTSGYCSCWGGAGCVSPGTIGPESMGGVCYTCQPGGYWGGSPITDGCPTSITCGSCN